MGKPVTIPNTFQAQGGPIPLVQLDGDFTAVSAVVNDLATYSNYLSDTGTVNALVATIAAGLTFSLTTGVQVQVQVLLTTTTTTPTLNVNASGAKSIVNSDNTALVVGQLEAGQFVTFIYDGTAWRVISANGGTSGPINATALSINGNPVHAGFPQSIPNANYVTVLADANTNLSHTSGAAHTYTIAANASVAYIPGTQIIFTNPTGAGVLTIAINTDTLELSPSGATGSRTLAASGIATAIKVAATTWMISGTGLT